MTQTEYRSIYAAPRESKFLPTPRDPKYTKRLILNDMSPLKGTVCILLKTKKVTPIFLRMSVCTVELSSEFHTYQDKRLKRLQHFSTQRKKNV